MLAVFGDFSSFQNQMSVHMCNDRWQDGLDRRAEEKQPAHQADQPVPGLQHVRRHQRQVRQQLRASQHKNLSKVTQIKWLVDDREIINTTSCVYEIRVRCL